MTQPWQSMKTHRIGMRTRLLPQRGVSLLFALLALAALALAAVGLVRTVGTGMLAVGNLGFKLDATATTDRGAELAIAWLQANAASLDATSSADGYYATGLTALDPTGRNTSSATRVVVDWDQDGSCASTEGSFATCIAPRPALPIGTSANMVSWVITRLCAAAGSAAPSTNSCAVTLPSGQLASTNKGDSTYNGLKISTTANTSPYYRIVVRAKGGRNSVSFTETVVHF